MFYLSESSVLEVDGTLKYHLLGVVFGTCLRRGLQDDIFADFDDFGLHLGIPWETVLGPLVDFGGFSFWSNFGAKQGRFWEGRRQWVAQDLARSCKWIPHARLPLRGAADLRGYAHCRRPLCRPVNR